MKKVVCLLLTVSLFFCFSACGVSDPPAVAQQAESTANEEAKEPAAEESAAEDKEAVETMEENISSVSVVSAPAGKSTIRYIRFGSGEKTMVILPGLTPFFVTDSADAVAAGFGVFTDDFTIYLFDMPDEIADNCTLAELSETNAELMKDLGLSDIYLYGISMGGMMSTYIAGEHPELVAKLLLGSTSCRSNDTVKAVIGEWIAFASAGDREGFGKSGAAHVYSKAVQDAYGDALTVGYSELSDEALERFCRIANAAVDFDFTAQAEKITCPVLVIGSLGDIVLTSEASEELAELTGGELFMYDEGFGHAVYDEAPDYRQRVFDFYIG